MNRSVVLTTAVLFGFLLVALRLAELMLLQHQRLSERALRQYLAEEVVKPERGLILDRRGRELAMNLQAQSLYCDPQQVRSPGVLARKVSAVLGLEYSEALRRLTRAQRRFVWLKRRVSEAQAQQLKGLQGLGLVPEPQRFYPAGELAAHVLGFVNIDNVGQSGVEAYYQEALTSRGLRLQVIKDARGRVLRQGPVPQRRGHTLVLTLDAALQLIAEEAAEEALRRWQASASMVIIMEPHTGAVLALANRPTFDPNRPAQAGPRAWRNRAIADLYEPGSTFKLVVAAAVLQEGLLQEGEVFDVSKGYIEVAGRKFWDVHRHEQLSFEEIIQKSSNVGAIMLAQRLGPQRLYRWAKRLGFGQRTGIDLPGEAKGVLRPPEEFSGTTLAAMAIGYEVSATALQVLRAYAAVANGGYLVQPYVVAQVLSADGQLISQHRPRRQRVLSPQVASRLREILLGVTQQGGTAPGVSLLDEQVSGKTGTARLYLPELGGYGQEYVSSFVGFVPAHEPKLAAIVVVVRPRGQVFGGQVAGPIFKELAEKTFSYLNIPVRRHLLVLGKEAEA
jgi:cell division protein FtsI (penicillin-binding protein 3)